MSQIAFITFEQKDYFFKQKALEAYISDFIRNLPNVDSDPEILRMDSEAVLKSIEAQHGLFVERAKSIYSFSHLTFQEYFAAKEIVANSAYKNLVKHLTERRWREVFLLTASMMRNADDLLRLMKQTIDKMIATDEKLQQFLSWVNQKSSPVEVPHKPAAIRAFYFSLGCAAYDDMNFDFDATGVFIFAVFDLVGDIDSDFDLRFAPHSCLDLDLTHRIKIVHSMANNIDIARDYDRHVIFDTLGGDYDYDPFLEVPRELDSTLTKNLDPNSELKRKLQELQAQFSNSLVNRERFERWWKEDGQIWTEQLRTVIIEHRNICHNWQFSDEQRQLLKQYYDANKLLVNCLNSDCYVSRDVRQEIEDTLLLPMSEIVRDRISPT